MKSEATKLVRLRSFLRTSSKNNSVSRIIDTFSRWSNSGYKMWLGSVASISRSPSHWPTKFSVKAAAFGLASNRSTCCAEHVGLAQLLLLGEREELVVGHRAPEKVRQPAGQGKVVELARPLAEEQELGRDQHALQGGPHRRLERVTVRQLGLDDGHERRDVVSGHGPAKRPAREVLEDSLGIDERLDPRQLPRGRRSC